MKTSLTKFLAAIFWALVLGAAAPSASGAGSHLVFAHYMVCFADYGDTVDGFKRDIGDAQAAGVDGFALNCGEWNGPDWYYKSRVEMMYQAAEQLSTGFKLFFSVEMTNTSDIVQMISTYAGRTNTFRQDGKVVVSTFGQNQVDWSNSVFLPLKKKGISVFFIPFFWPDNMAELPAYQDGVNILNTYSNLLDGLFLFGAVGRPTQLARCNSNYTAAVHGTGKTFMAGITPHYWGCAQASNGRRYVETDGGEGTILQWQSIIENQPDWVEIVTWNDFNESTYISPVENPEQHGEQLNPPRRYSHAGYLELTKHYIAWYKTGQEPPVARDALFYFYRTHSTNAVASNPKDVPVTSFSGDTADMIYNTLFLTAPTQLEIYSGGNWSTNALTAGIQCLRTPFTPGTQAFTLERNGKVMLSVSGPPILAQITNYDYFPASGYAYASLLPPRDRRSLEN